MKCALVIERENAGPLVVSSDSFYQLSKFKNKLDEKSYRTNIKSLTIVSLMDLDDLMSIEIILKESTPEPPQEVPGIPP